MSPVLEATIATAVIQLATKVLEAVFARKSPAEIARIALEEATKIDNIQKLYDERAKKKFPGYRP